MGIRFRKSIKILPGIRVNLGLNGASLSMGPRGASVSIGKREVYANASIPGTGISFRNKIGGNSKQQSRLSAQQLKELEKQNTENTTHSIVLNMKEDGTIIYKDSNEDELSRAMINMAWEQNADTISSWIKNEATKINDMDMISSLHCDMPYPNSEPEIEKLDFPETIPKKPTKKSIKELSLFQKLFSSKAKKQYQEDLNNTKSAYIKELESWTQNLEVYEKKKKKHEREQLKLADNFSELIRNKIDTMSTYLEKVYNGLNWPRETLISYEISNNKKTIFIDIDLPEIEDIPQKTAAISSTGKKLNIKQKTEKQLRLEYATHIHAIALRISAYTFATLPSLETVVLSGYSQRLDKSTGSINDEYLYSVKFDRKSMLKIDYNNLEQLDTIESFQNFEHIRKMTTTGIFKQIEPYNNVETLENK